MHDEPPQTLTGEIACILEDCGPPEFQSPEALAELISNYQPTWTRIVAALQKDATDPYKLGKEWCPICHHDDGAHDPTCKYAMQKDASK